MNPKTRLHNLNQFWMKTVSRMFRIHCMCLISLQN